MFTNRKTSDKLRLRLWGEFFAKRSFKTGISKNNFFHNVFHYQANYLCLLCSVLVVYLCFFASYACMMMVALVIAVGYYLFVHRQTPIAIGKLPPLNRQHLRIIFIIGSLLVCWIFGGLSCLFAVFTGLLLGALHAAFHRAPQVAGPDFDASQPMAAGPMDSVLNDDELRDEEDPVASEELLQQQARYRATFRANMRAKYLPGNEVL